MKKRKNQKPLNKQRWNKQIKFYHNKGSGHFFLCVGYRGDYVAGHDLTTHPTLNRKGKPKNKYIALFKNPNPNDKRKSFMDKHLRKNLKIHFQDSGKKRLTKKQNWKLSKRDKKRIKRLDRNKI